MEELKKSGHKNEVSEKSPAKARVSIYMPEEEWFYVSEGYKPLECDDKSEKDNLILSYKVLIMLIETRVNGCKAEAQRIYDYYINPVTAKQQIHPEKDSDTKNLVERICELDKEPESAQPEIYTELIQKLAAIVLRCNFILPAKHKIGILHRICNIGLALTRRVAGIKLAKVATPCERCKKDVSYPNPRLHCGHVFCKSCLALTCIFTKVLVPAGIVPIKCPDKSCNAILTQQEMRQAMGSNAFLYEDLRLGVPEVCAMCTNPDAPGRPLLHVKCKVNPALKVCVLCATFIDHNLKMEASQECSCFCNRCKVEEKK